MAISKIQQSQVSGSLSFDDSLAAGSGLAGKATLKGDLDALRSQVNKIIGKSNWFDALDGTQDLADIYAAVHMSGADAEFQGDIQVGGNDIKSSGGTVALSLDGANVSIAGAGNVAGNLAVGGGYGDTGVTLYSNGNLSMDGAMLVKGAAQFDGNVILGDAAADTITFNGVAASALDMDAHKIEGLAQASAAGDALAWGQDASVSDLIVTGGDFQVTAGGAVSAASIGVTGNAMVGGTLGVVGNSSLASADIGGGYGSSGVTISSAGNVSMNGSLMVDGAAALNGGLVMDTDKFVVADGTGNTSIAGTLGVQGATTLASLGVTGNAMVGGTLGVVGHSTVSTFEATGLAELLGGVDVNGLATISAAGDAVFATLDVVGAADFDGAMTAASIAIDGDVAQRLYFVGADGSITDNAALNWDIAASRLDITGSLDVSDDLRVRDDALIDGSLDVVGLSSLDGGIEVGAAKFTVSSAGAMYVDGASQLHGAATLDSSLTVAGASDLNGTLDVQGAARFQSNVVVDGNAQIHGDLLVQGAFTYIETENMRVKDAFIYLATGSAGSGVDSGIVFSKGADSGTKDLILGQDGGAGEFIFAQQTHNADADSPSDLNNATLVPAWMSVTKYGASEGTEAGKVGMDGADFAVKGTNGLLLKAGSESFSLAGAGEQATFDGKFDATTIIGALNELHTDLAAASAGGNLSKASYGVADFAGNVLSFAGQQTLASADHKLVDVYLNGVLMSPGRDLTAISTTSVTFDSSIVSALIADDVIVVIARG